MFDIGWPASLSGELWGIGRWFHSLFRPTPENFAVPQFVQALPCHRRVPNLCSFREDLLFLCWNIWSQCQWRTNYSPHLQCSRISRQLILCNFGEIQIARTFCLQEIESLNHLLLYPDFCMGIFSWTLESHWQHAPRRCRFWSRSGSAKVQSFAYLSMVFLSEAQIYAL